jgi:hypothetical protein
LRTTYLGQGTLGRGLVDGDLELPTVVWGESGRSTGGGSDVCRDSLRDGIGNCGQGSESECSLHIERVNSAVEKTVMKASDNCL